MVSQNYPQYTITRQLSNLLKSMQETKKSTSAISRAFLKGIITDSKVFGNSNTIVIFKTHPVIDTACSGKILKIILVLNT